MVMPGETINFGAPDICPQCLERVTPGVYHSDAGYYIGTYCGCGPYSRESVRYWDKRVKALEAYETGNYERRR